MAHDPILSATPEDTLKINFGTCTRRVANVSAVRLQQRIETSQSSFQPSSPMTDYPNEDKLPPFRVAPFQNVFMFVS